MSAVTVSKIYIDFGALSEKKNGLQKESRLVERVAKFFRLSIDPEISEAREKLDANYESFSSRIYVDMNLEERGNSLAPEEIRCLELELLALGFDFFMLKEKSKSGKEQIITQFLDKISGIYSEYQKCREKSDIILGQIRGREASLTVIQRSLGETKNLLRTLTTKITTSPVWKSKFSKHEVINLAVISDVLRRCGDAKENWGIIKELFKDDEVVKLLYSINSSLIKLSVLLTNLENPYLLVRASSR